MIVEVILNPIFWIVRSIIGLFPALPMIQLDFLDDVVGAISLVHNFINLKVFAGCMVVILVLLNANLIWSVIMWVVRKIPGIK